MTLDEEALRMATQLSYLLTPPPEGIRVMGPAEAPVFAGTRRISLSNSVGATRRPLLREVLHRLRNLAEQQRWKATALVIDVDPISLM